MRKSFSGGKCLDYSEVTEEDDESFMNEHHTDDKSLETIVKRAQQEIQDSSQVRNLILVPIITFFIIILRPINLLLPFFHSLFTLDFYPNIYLLHLIFTITFYTFYINFLR